jgi:16S rRNA (guanine966-N2)-methyltransferase
LGGRVFDSPGTHKTHPMSEKVRGALFNALGDISGLTVLDAFAGSGALSFEAVSRGAVQATTIESDRLAQNVIADNIKKLGLLSRVKLIRASAGAWLSTNPNARFDIVLCDPPYDNVQSNLLIRLSERLSTDGILVLSLPPHAGFTLPAVNYRLISSKPYGDAVLYFYRRPT